MTGVHYTLFENNKDKNKMSGLVCTADLNSEPDYRPLQHKMAKQL